MHACRSTLEDPTELLKAEALRTRGDRSLGELRGRLGHLVGLVTGDWPVRDAEERVAGHLAELTVGVAGRIPFLGTTSIDDSFLARVFEFLVASAGSARVDAYRLEGEGLGYANLVEIAVVLAAIPDLTRLPDPATHRAGDGSDVPVSTSDDVMDDLPEEALRDQMVQAEAAREMEDETLFARQFHAVVVLEEPEAHLHTQLQHGLITYLREVVATRPEVQVIITTHSDQIVSACDPEELVVFTSSQGAPVARTVKSFGLAETHLTKVRRHLDVARAAGLFADRLVVVEGITDALLLRQFGRLWAGDDRVKRRFVEALTITVAGSRVGQWLPRLLTRDGAEIVSKLALLGDSDGRSEPAWVATARGQHFDAFWNEPTLEPSLVDGNEALVAGILDEFGVDDSELIDPELITPGAVDDYFSDAGRRYKAQFAEAVATRMREQPDEVTIPDHLRAVLEFVWGGFLPAVLGTGSP